MDHKTCRENLSAYLDGELPREEKVLLENHLAGCPECGKALAGLKSLSLILHKHAMEPVPLSLKEKVFAEPKEKPAYYEWFRPVLAASMAAAGVLITLNIMKGPEPEQMPLPALPRSTAFEKAKANMPAESSLQPLESAGLSAAGTAGPLENASAPQTQPVSGPRAAGAFGQAKSASVFRSEAGYKSTAFAGKMESSAEAAASGERASALRSSQVSARAGASGAFGQAKPAPAPHPEAEYKGTAFASGKAASAVRGASARAGSKPGKRAFPVGEFILGTYTAGDEHYGRKAANRFRTTAVEAASEADKGGCGNYAKFILDDGIYCILPDGAGRQFHIKRFNKEDMGTATPGKQLWDIFEYGEGTYLILNATHSKRHFFEYYLLEPEKVRLQGEIDYGGH